MADSSITIEAPTITAPVITPPVPDRGAKKHGRPIPTLTEPPAEVMKMEFKMNDDLLKPDRERIIMDEPIHLNPNTKGDVPPITTLPKEENVADKPTDKVKETKEPIAPADKLKDEGKKVEEPPKLKSPLDILKMPTKADDKYKEEIKSADTAARDYSIFDQDEQVAAKQMSNDAFKLAVKLKTTSKNNNEHIFYQHPEAYTTHPQYKKAVATVEQGTFEYNYWQSQLLACKSNKPVKELLSYDKQGNPVYGAEIPASPLVEEQIRELMYNTQNATNNARASLQNIQKQYKDEYKTVRTNFDSERTKRFAWVQNPALLDATLDLDNGQGGVVTKSVKQIKEDFKSLFPAYLVNDMAVEVASDLLVTNLMTKAFYTAQTTKDAVKQTIESEAKLVEPTSSDKPTSKGDAFGGLTEFSDKNMPSGL